MHYLYWMYKGYSGDEFGFVERPEQLAAKFVGEAKSSMKRHFSALTQRGFGPGYFNNSGVCFDFQRSAFKSADDRDAFAATLKGRYDIHVYADREAYMEHVEKLRSEVKALRRANPY